MIRRILWLAASLLSLLVTGAASAAQPPQSMLVLVESDLVGPFYREAYTALQSTVNTKASRPVSIFLEQLELEWFGSEHNESTLRTYLKIQVQRRSELEGERKAPERALFSTAEVEVSTG